jgi:hypothetical protein
MRPGWAISEGQPKTSQRSPLDYSPKDWRSRIIGTLREEIILEVPEKMANDAAAIL